MDGNISVIIDGNNWNDYQLGPDHIERPERGETKGYYLIKSDNIEDIWKKIKEETKNGLFGHYSAISPKRNLIVVHFRYHEQEKTDRAILHELTDLGVDPDCVEFRKRAEENNLTNHLINCDTFETRERVRTPSGKTVTRDQYESNPQHYDGLRFIKNE